MELKPCPCGKTPEKLMLEVLAVSRDEEQKIYGYRVLITPSCCQEWTVDFHATNGDSMNTIADESWNAAPRAGQ